MIVIGRFIPSSKFCNVCGNINNNLELKERFWKCVCGAFHDRDVLTANNIKKFGLIKNNINVVGQVMSEVTPIRYEHPIGYSE
ncbi:MAG: zinc ribbon domain-containing protein [Candidatus Ranarchaeia archaeon]